VSELRRREHLEELFVDHAAAVRAYALRRIDQAAAEETVSEVFMIAWRRLDDVPSDPLPWLSSVPSIRPWFMGLRSDRSAAIRNARR
jgi:DNA-directed RNA polymerase specialized sigma24 family protein